MDIEQILNEGETSIVTFCWGDLPRIFAGRVGAIAGGQLEKTWLC
ncbi:hypothetical protein [Thermosynechococcus sp.]|nr:hypothetical protein [Thermosynechococcus sp.]